METNIQDKQNTKYELFKSYYVVWKRNLDILLRNFEGLFKSYYVVWKQDFRTLQYAHRECLNRTMQYGNLIAIGLFGVVDPV